MVFTRPRATRGLLYKIVQVAKRYRLWGHKTKVFRAGQPKVITGVVVTMQGLRLPNQRQQAIAAELNVLKTARTDEERLSIMPSLMGRRFEAAQVDATWRSKRCRFLDLWRTCGGERPHQLPVAHLRARSKKEIGLDPQGVDRFPRGLTMLARTCVAIVRLATGGAIAVKLP